MGARADLGQDLRGQVVHFHLHRAGIIWYYTEYYMVLYYYYLRLRGQVVHFHLHRGRGRSSVTSESHAAGRAGPQQRLAHTTTGSPTWTGDSGPLGP